MSPFAQSSLETTLRHEPLAALPLLFAAGLATSLTPCVYPMIPITAGILGGVGATGMAVVTNGPPASSRWRLVEGQLPLHAELRCVQVVSNQARDEGALLVAVLHAIPLEPMQLLLGEQDAHLELAGVGQIVVRS